MRDSFEIDLLPTIVYYGGGQFSYKDDILIDGNDIVGHVVSHIESLLRVEDSLGVDSISYSCHEDLNMEFELRDSILFYDNMTNVNDEHRCVSYNVVSIATLKEYQLFENLLWCDDTLFDDENLFLGYDSIFIGGDCVRHNGTVYSIIIHLSWCVSILGQGLNMLESISEPSYDNTLDEIYICDTFLHYLLAYDYIFSFE